MDVMSMCLRKDNVKGAIISDFSKGAFYHFKGNAITLTCLMLSWIPDKYYIPIFYIIRTGKRLNLKSPVTYNEKLQWLKLYDRNPLYAKLADKYEVRRYVADVIGEKYIIPLLGVWDSFQDINFDMLPKQFVLKCTHDSGSFVICKDKSIFDIVEAGKFLSRRLKRNYYLKGREWVYKSEKPHIIAEKYMEDIPEKELMDYKIFCFDGEPKLIQVNFDCYSQYKRNFYTPEWEYIPVSIVYPTYPEIKIDKPKHLDEMLDLAKKLSTKIPHVRVDLYQIRDRIYFGEMSFYSESGCGKISPESFGVKMGSWLKLPEKYERNRP